MRSRRLVPIIAVVLAISAAAAYWGAWKNQFVWDDPIFFQEQLPYFPSLSSVFFPPKNIPQWGQSYYRPLIVLTYQLDEAVAAKFWPLQKRDDARRVVYHTTQVAWHAAATVLVFLLGIVLNRVIERAGSLGLAGSAGAALLFAVHPIHTESVAWMAGRTDVVCAAFFLAAMIFYLIYRRTAKFGWLLGSGAAAFLSMLAKENGLGIILLIPIIDLVIRPGSTLELKTAGEPRAAAWRPNQRSRELRRAGNRAKAPKKSAKAVAAPRSGTLSSGLFGRWAVFGIVVAAYAVLRQAGIGGSGLALGAAAGRRLNDLPAALGWYVIKTVWPPPQSAYIAEIPGWPGVLVGLSAAAVSTALLVLWCRRKTWGREAISLSLFYATLAPALATVVLSVSKTPLAERYLYLPSAGAVLLFGFIVERTAVRFLPAASPTLRQVVVAGTALALALPATAATVDRASVWRSDLAFWQDTVRKAPRQGIPHLQLGTAYAKQGKMDAAIEEFKMALEFYKDNAGRAKAHGNLGSAYLYVGRRTEAIEEFKAALADQPDYASPHYNWAVALLTTSDESRAEGRNEEAARFAGEAMDHLQQAIAINPRYPKACLQLGIELLRAGRTGEGRGHLEQVVRMAPASPEAAEARRVLTGGIVR